MTVEPPVRVAHRYRQRLDAAPAAVFPMLCPVRETEWVEGWAPTAVYTSSGYAEADCVFVTPDGEADAVWVVTEYDPDAYRIGFVKTIPGKLVVRIQIALHGCESGGTLADVGYTYTALSAAGAAVVDAMTEEAYTAFMHEWEAALNRHLSAPPAPERPTEA